MTKPLGSTCFRGVVVSPKVVCFSVRGGASMASRVPLRFVEFLG